MSSVATLEGTSVAVSGLTKTYALPREQMTTLRERFGQPFRRGQVDVLQALDDVSFTLAPGEFVGIVGRNGSGKSTLLKCLSGIYSPDRGEVRVAGRLAPFIELGVGFNDELTARDNTIINLVLLGLSAAQARDRVDDVIAFADLQPFRDLKLKNYSSGMRVRLAFAVTVQVEADVLLFDEVLAVGDAAFQRKCEEQFAALHSQGRTVVLVTHDMEEVRDRCDRAILLEGGRLVADGDPDRVADEYLRVNRTGGLTEGAAQRVERPPGTAAAPRRPKVPISPRQYAESVFTLAAAEFKLRYLYAKLGYLWAVARPLAMFSVIYLFTTRVAKLDQGDHFAVYLLAAIVLWTFFEQATHSSVQALVHHEPLLRKVPINHSIVPLSVVLTALLDLAMNLVAVAVLLVASRVKARIEWLEIPLLVLVLTMLAAGLSLGLSALYVRFRDLTQIWQVATYALFFGTPIFYAIDTLPEGARRWFLLNPIAVVMTQLRHVLVDPEAPSAAQAMGGARYLAGPLAVIVVAFVAGVLVFRRESPRVAERL